MITEIKKKYAGGSGMGRYLNQGNESFEKSVNSEIYIDNYLNVMLKPKEYEAVIG